MAYILDIAVILLFILMVFIGYRRGFVKTAVRLVGSVLAIILAGALSPMIAEGVFDTFAAQPIEAALAEEIGSASMDTVMKDAQEVIEKIPAAITNAMEAFGLGTPEQILENAREQVSGSVAALPGTIVGLIRPVAVALLSALCFLILVVVLLIVAAFVASLVSKLFSIPLLKQLNGLLGAVLGAAQGVLLVLVAVTVIQLIANSSAPDALISRPMVEQSIVVSRLAEFNPITNLFNQFSGAQL